MTTPRRTGQSTGGKSLGPAPFGCLFTLGGALFLLWGLSVVWSWVQSSPVDTRSMISLLFAVLLALINFTLGLRLLQQRSKR